MGLGLTKSVITNINPNAIPSTANADARYVEIIQNKSGGEDGIRERK